MNTERFKRGIFEELDYLDRTDPITNPTRHTWAFRRKALREEIRNHNADFDHMYHWPTIHDAFLTGATPETLKTYEMLNQQFKSVSADPPVGGIGDSKLLKLPNGGSGTFARQALVCELLVEHTQQDPHEWEDVFEFGGGFGALAYLLRRVGFVDRHIIYDFPECLILQRWYLGTLGISGIEYINDIDSLTPAQEYHEIFISVCALEEAPLEKRLEILHNVDAAYYLIWYHKAYNSVDNHSWFKKYFLDEGIEITQYESPDVNQGIIIAER